MLDGYTRNSAYAEFMEKRLGTLEPGKLADLIVLSQDLSKIAPSSIGQTKVLLTLVGGKEVWGRDGRDQTDQADDDGARSSIAAIVVGLFF